MDEYAEYLYKRRPYYKNINTGDISEQVAIRKKLNCKPFSWFMKEVAFDLYKFYPPVEPEDLASGHVRDTLCGYSDKIRAQDYKEKHKLNSKQISD